MPTSLDRFKKKVANLFKESGEVKQQKVSANQNSQTLEVPVAAPKQNMPPKTKAELIKILRRCNPNVLSDHEKRILHPCEEYVNALFQLSLVFFKINSENHHSVYYHVLE